MTTAAMPTVLVTEPRERGAGGLNGDWHLNPKQVRAYVEHHRERNAQNAELSRREGVRTRQTPARWIPLSMSGSPSRAALNAFFQFAAETLAPRFVGREVTILDIGTGSAPCLSAFEAAGFRGTYIGLDIRRNPRWSDEPTAAFRKRLI